MSVDLIARFTELETEISAILAGRCLGRTIWDGGITTVNGKCSTREGDVLMVARNPVIHKIQSPI